MKVQDLLYEMANLIISGRGQPIVKAYCRTYDGIIHWKSIKVTSPSNIEMTVPWDSNKGPIYSRKDSKTAYTLDVAYNFIKTYEFLLNALWNKKISHDIFISLYERSKVEGLDKIQQEVQNMINTNI